MLDKLDAALRFGTEALNLRAQRQEILASNIANADTPGYQARDIDFASQLSKVMENGRAEGSSMALKVTSSRHIAAENQFAAIYGPDVPHSRSTCRGWQHRGYGS